MTPFKATLIGFCAVLLWSLLALFTVATAPVPPFQLNAMAFSIGGILGLVWMRTSGQSFAEIRMIAWPVWLLGVIGLFGYHALYFSALRMVPAAEAGLIAYLWPLLIVLFSGLLPGETLRLGHIAGAGLSLAGAAFLILGSGDGFSTRYLPGYGLAFACALTWSGYSVLSRKTGATPTGAVAFYCLAASILSFLAHFAFETTVWPRAATGWFSVVMLGIGPVGLAFYLWDIGMKRGNIQTLGAASYAAPLLSTVILVAAGFATATRTLAIATALIAGGALWAARTRERRP